MGLILSFAPFIAFAVLAERIGAPAALAIGAIIGLVLAARSRLNPPHVLNVLDAGATILMGALALYAAFAGAALSLVAVRFCVDLGLFLIVATTIAVGRPFTLPYARQQVDPALWDHPIFLRTNNRIAGAWAGAFAVMAAVEGFMLLQPAFPRPVGAVLVILALGAALAFTSYYPKRVRSAALAAAAAAR